jgi:hypothetical protein
MAQGIETKAEISNDAARAKTEEVIRTVTGGAATESYA